MSERWVPLGEITRPHGVRGEVRLRVFNQDSDLLLEIEEVRVGEARMIVDHARRANEAILMKLRGVDDRDQAEALRGARVAVRRADFPALEAGEFYACDLEGAKATLGDRESGEVKELRAYPSVDVLVIVARAAEGTERWEVPLTDAYVERVDVSARRVVLKSLDDLEPERA